MQRALERCPLFLQEWFCRGNFWPAGRLPMPPWFRSPPRAELVPPFQFASHSANLDPAKQHIGDPHLSDSTWQFVYHMFLCSSEHLSPTSTYYPHTFRVIMIVEEVTLSERIRRLGYAKGTQVKLYGQTFDLVSDPVYAGGDLVFVDALEQKSGRRTRVRIPLNIVHVARQGRARLSASRQRKIS